MKRPPWMQQAFAGKPLIGIDELAQASGICEDVLRDHIRAGHLPFVQKGHGTKRVHRQFAPEHVNTFLKALQQRESSRRGR